MVDPVTGTMIATAATTAGSSGFYGIIIILVLIVLPFIVKFWNWTKETSAQGTLYAQLSEMVQNQRRELDNLYSQRKADQEEIFRLRLKVEHLEEENSTVEILKKKLDEKDAIIAERDARITSLLQEIMHMKERVHNLEIRLKEDEIRFCEGCVFKDKNIKVLNYSRETNNEQNPSNN